MSNLFLPILPILVPILVTIKSFYLNPLHSNHNDCVCIFMGFQFKTNKGREKDKPNYNSVDLSEVEMYDRKIIEEVGPDNKVQLVETDRDLVHVLLEIFPNLFDSKSEFSKIKIFYLYVFSTNGFSNFYSFFILPNPSRNFVH